MAKITRLYLDHKQRQNFSEKQRRSEYLKLFLTHKRKFSRKRCFKSYCLLTNSARSIYYGISLSRHSFRKYANFGYMPGIISSSW